MTQRLPDPAPEPDFDADAIYDRLTDDLVRGLRRRGAGRNAPAVGQPMPPFALPDADGTLRRLDEIVAGAPAIISFVRGQWCPYCEAELADWNRTLAALADDAVRFVCVVGATGGAAAAIRACFAGPVNVLCDVDHGLALELGLAFHLGEPFLAQYRAEGLDLADVYGSAAGLLPIPATFALDAGGVVRCAFVEPDFRLRADPAVMLAAVGLPVPPAATSAASAAGSAG